MSSFVSFSWLEHVDWKTKHTVFGYLREIHKITFIDGSLMALERYHYPQLIAYISLSYFCEMEYFAKPGYKTKISNNKRTITKYGGIGFDNVTYCNLQIPSTSNMVFNWTFQINKFGFFDPNHSYYGNYDFGMYFGFVSQRNLPNDAVLCPLLNNTEYGNCLKYGIMNDGSKSIDGKWVHSSMIECQKGFRFGFNDDVIMITLDLSSCEIIGKNINSHGKQHNKDRETYYVLFKDIEMKANLNYSLIISMLHIDATVTLMDFTQET
eukprot:113342_1